MSGCKGVAMNFRQLEIFRAVMVAGSASRAADLLQVTQPAISRAISDLEESLAFPLFDRLRGRLVPTLEGRLFFRDVSASFIGLDHLRSSAARIRAFGSGEIRIASLPALGSTLVPDAIRAFRDEHPHIAITLEILGSAAVRNLVADGRFDIGLVTDEIDLPGVNHKPFANFRAVCAIPPGHALATKPVIRPADLQGVPFIALAPADRVRSRFKAALDAEGVTPDIVVETPYSHTVCALALVGVGVGLVNPYSVDGYVERGLILRPFEPAMIFSTYMLFRPDAQKSRLVQRFANTLNMARDRRRPLWPE
jgi:DNA-binding transcriptional LysR family regulator